MRDDALVDALARQVREGLNRAPVALADDEREALVCGVIAEFVDPARGDARLVPHGAAKLAADAALANWHTALQERDKARAEQDALAAENERLRERGGVEAVIREAERARVLDDLTAKVEALRGSDQWNRVTNPQRDQALRDVLILLAQAHNPETGP